MQGSNVSLVGFHVLGLSSAFPFSLVAFDASCEPCVGPACIRCCPFTCRKLSQGSRGSSLVLILRGAPPSRQQMAGAGPEELAWEAKTVACVFNPGVPAAREARVLGSRASDIMCKVCWCSEQGPPEGLSISRRSPAMWLGHSRGPFCSLIPEP